MVTTGDGYPVSVSSVSLHTFPDTDLKDGHRLEPAPQDSSDEPRYSGMSCA